MHKKRVDIVHMELVKDGSVLYGDEENRTRKISTPEEAAKFAASFFRNSDREKIYVCTLSASMEPINICLVIEKNAITIWISFLDTKRR